MTRRTLAHGAEWRVDVAQNFDLQSIPLVRAIFWLRALVLSAARSGTHPVSDGDKGPGDRRAIATGRIAANM
jgi:hypothetical protein